MVVAVVAVVVVVVMVVVVGGACTVRASYILLDELFSGLDSFCTRPAIWFSTLCRKPSILAQTPRTLP